MSDYSPSPLPPSAPIVAGPQANGPRIAGFDLKQLLMIAAAVAAAYWLYQKYYGPQAAALAKEGYTETSAEKTGCAKSLLGNYLTCDKYATQFQGRQKSAVERYQDDLAEKREKAQPLLPDIKLPPVQDHVLPKATSFGKWDRVTDLRGSVDVSYSGSLTQVAPAAIDAVLANNATAKRT